MVIIIIITVLKFHLNFIGGHQMCNEPGVLICATKVSKTHLTIILKCYCSKTKILNFANFDISYLEFVHCC